MLVQPERDGNRAHANILREKDKYLGCLKSTHAPFTFTGVTQRECKFHVCFPYLHLPYLQGVLDWNERGRWREVRVALGLTPVAGKASGARTLDITRQELTHALSRCAH